jgi:hypothetical protein
LKKGWKETLKAVVTQARKHYMFVDTASHGNFERIRNLLLKSHHSSKLPDPHHDCIMTLKVVVSQARGHYMFVDIASDGNLKR